MTLESQVPIVRRLIVAIVTFFLATAVADTNAAGLFEKLKAKRQAKLREVQQEKKQSVVRVPRHRSHYADAHQDAWFNDALLEDSEDLDRRVVVDIARQRAFLIIDGMVAIDTAVSTGRGSKYTPRGSFNVTEKVQSGKVSTVYHVYMPNWMRLGHTMIGMHTGDLPGYPASAGCIRLPQSVAPIMFQHVSVGTPVEVMDSWDEQDLALPYSYPYQRLLVTAL